MKKIMLILVVLAQTTLFAQSKQTTEKPLKLSSVAVGTLSDDVLLRGATDQEVKRITVNNLLISKANIDSPVFTGTPTLPTGTIATTQTAGNNTTAIATTAFVTTADNLKANLASPTFTGTPTLPAGTIAAFQSSGNNSTAVASTSYVDSYTIHKTGNETFSGVKTMSTTAVASILLTQNGGYGGNGIQLTNNNPNNTNASMSVFSIVNNVAGPGGVIENYSTGSGLMFANVGTGMGGYVLNTSTGKGFVINNTTGTGIPFSIQKNAFDKLTINEAGQVTGTAYNLSALNTVPASATATGTLGEIRFTASGIYICTAVNTWIKCVGATF